MSEGTPDEDVFPGAKLSDPAMVRAMGGALAVPRRVAGRERRLAVEETSNVLGIYAVITETAPDEGLILACWAECCVMRHRKGRKGREPGKWDWIGQRGRAGWGEPLASPIHEAGILGCSDCVQPIAV
jgi:hypothetical protein